jgi:hypothetical protein
MEENTVPGPHHVGMFALRIGHLLVQSTYVGGIFWRINPTFTGSHVQFLRGQMYQWMRTLGVKAVFCQRAELSNDASKDT